MKAIHNGDVNASAVGATVFNISKIQNESNSQQYCYKLNEKGHCVQYFKDTK